jgi:leader peptidase (prepilin peptidase)/N-methyltransferase
MSSVWVWEAAAFVVGLVFGSFLNVCIARLPYHESIVKPRSHCPSCLFPIRWYDNIPLVSFVVLRGRCRKCFQRISWRYPTIELVTGLWFFLCFGRFWSDMNRTHDFGIDLSGATSIAIPWVAAAILGFLLIGLLVMDWQTHRLPDAFTLTGTAIGFLLVCIQAVFLAPGQGDIHLHHSMRMSSPGSMVERGDVFLSGTEVMVFGRVAAIIAAFALLHGVRLLYRAVRKREGMGAGDAKLLAMIAAFLGFWPAILALFVGIISASVYAAVLLARRRANALSRLPIGSFIAAGGLLAALFGPAIIGWYSSLL